MARFDPLQPMLRAGEVVLPAVTGNPRPSHLGKKSKRRKRGHGGVGSVCQKHCACVLCRGKVTWPAYYGDEMIERGGRKIVREQLARERAEKCHCALCREVERLAKERDENRRMKDEGGRLNQIEMKPSLAADDSQVRIWMSFECRIEDQAVDPDAEEFARLRNEPVRAGLGAWASTPELERQFRWSETDPRGELVERRRQIGVLLARLEGNLITDVKPHWPKDWRMKVRLWIAGELERIDLALKEKN